MLTRTWLEEAAEAMRPTMIGTLGLEVLGITGEGLAVRMPYAIALTSIGGEVHSGALVGLANTAAYIAVLNHDTGAIPLLTHSTLVCLGPATADVTAMTRMVFHENRRAVVEVTLRSEMVKIALVHAEFRLKG